MSPRRLLAVFAALAAFVFPWSASASPGSLDSSYDLHVMGNYVMTSAVQSDGKTIIGGRFTTAGGEARTNIARLHADGTLDAAFTASTNNDVTSLAAQPDGKLLTGASSRA